MTEGAYTSARAKLARRNYIIFCSTATVVMGIVLLAVVVLLGGD
jgi:hypothetical protein